MKTQVNEIKQNLRQFSGSEMLFRIPLLNTRYTEGIKYLASAADCYWLITDVSVIGKSLMKKSYFITVVFKRLSQEKRSDLAYEAEITYSDGNGNIFKSQRYTATNFPLNELRLFFVDNTLMLPSEY